MSKINSILIGVVLVVAAAGAAAYPWWRAYVFPAQTAKDKDEHHHHDEDRVKISPQARANLNLVVDKVYPAKKPYVSRVDVPGWVVERPGSCERIVAAPIGGVIEELTAIRGDLVKPGETLFTIRIVSELVNANQANLYKALQEQTLAKTEEALLDTASKKGVEVTMKLAEVRSQIKIREALIKSLEQQLRLAGFGDKEIAQASAGKAVATITLAAPEFPPHAHAFPKGFAHDHVYEVEELKVLLGETVTPGQPLCVLADHQMLWIEGKVFATETELVQRAANARWKIQLRLPVDKENQPALDKPLSTASSKGGWWPTLAAKPWPAPPDDLEIVSVSNRVDPEQQTLSFFVLLPNPHQSFERGGKTYRLWQFRPGQRVELRLPSEPYDNVFVLPAAAVVRQGAETYVFRENGDFFDRIPVHVVHEDREVVLVENDGSLLPGTRIALNGAVQLNWALRIQQSGEGGGHHHHDH